MFRKVEKQVVTDLGALAEFHKAKSDALAEDYATGLSIINSVRQTADAEARKLSALSQHYMRAAEDLTHKFTVDPPTTVPGGGGGASSYTVPGQDVTVGGGGSGAANTQFKWTVNSEENDDNA